MKKFGFTLAEVMVALALIGVITSLTIPTFIASNRNRTNGSKAATMISAVENAFTSMIAAEAVQNLSETDFGRIHSAANLGRYIKIQNSSEDMLDYYGADNPFRLISINERWNNFTAEIIYETKNGALLIFDDDPKIVSQDDINDTGGTIDSSLGFLTIDINGSEPPNVWGRDAFYFAIGNDGLLYPAGSKNFSILESEGDTATNTWDSEDADAGNDHSTDFRCNDEFKGVGCTARLIQNNFEVDY